VYIVTNLIGVNDVFALQSFYATCIDDCSKRQQNSFYFQSRVSQNRIPLKSYYYRPQGRRTIGRPRKRWKEQL